MRSSRTPVNQEEGGGVLRPSRLQPPSRALLFHAILEGCKRHGITFKLSMREQSQQIKAALYDDLIDLAFFAMTDTGDEVQHKKKFLEWCDSLGLK